LGAADAALHESEGREKERAKHRGKKERKKKNTLDETASVLEKLEPDTGSGLHLGESCLGGTELKSHTNDAAAD
jgi:hypothetical protein